MPIAWLPLTTVLAAAAPPALPPRPLCVEEKAGAASLPAAVDDLLVSLRARLGSRRWALSPCAGKTPEGFRVLLEPATDAVRIHITGPDVDVEQTTSVLGASPRQRMQRVAVIVAEALRPVLELDLKEERAPEPEAPEAGPEPPEVTVAPAGATSTDPPQSTLWPAITTGPRLGVDERRLVAAVELAAAVDLGRVVVGLFAAAGGPDRASAAGAHLGVTALEAGVRASWRGAAWMVGLGVVGRVALLSLSGPTVPAERRAQSFSSVGADLQGSWFLWGSGALEVGVTGEAWLWPRQQRFTVGGVSISRTPHMEVMVGPSVRLTDAAR